MSPPSQAARTRIIILIVLVCLATFAWEAFRAHELQQTSGVISETIYRGYTIEYQISGQSYSYSTRVGVLDSFVGELRGLPVGARVPLLVIPGDPGRTTLDTLYARYGLSISFLALFLIFFLFVILKGFRAPTTSVDG